MFDKYRNTSAQLFKLRMQFKVEVNNLRKTYHQIVVQKPVPQRKHFLDKNFKQTQLTPNQEQSRKKQLVERKHYSPFSIPHSYQRSQSIGKKHFNEKNADNLTRIIKQKCQARKKSLSLVRLASGNNNRSMINLRSNNQKQRDGLKIGLNDKSLTKIQKPSKRIIFKYHQFNNILG